MITKVTHIMHINKIEESDVISIVCKNKKKEKNIKYVLQNHRECDKISVVIGPEGGLSEKEEGYLKEVGYIPVTLGNNIMRVETVPIFILSTINYEFME